MTDEGHTNDWAPRATAADPPGGSLVAEEPENQEPKLAPDEDELPDDELDEAPSRRPASGRRNASFVAGRALVVLVAAGISWYLVVPTHHVVRSRLSMLVVPKPGVAAYEKTKPQGEAQDDTKTGLTALARGSQEVSRPDRHLLDRMVPFSILGGRGRGHPVPEPVGRHCRDDPAEQAAAVGQGQLGGLADPNRHLHRPGSTGIGWIGFQPLVEDRTDFVDRPFRQGRVLSLAQVISSATTAKPDSIKLAVNQYANLRQVEPGFTMSVTDYPLLPSALWGAGRWPWRRWRPSAPSFGAAGLKGAGWPTRRS